MTISFELFADAQIAFDTHKIPLWLEHGTLLGMIREGKIIDGDDDIDLASLYHETVKYIDDISTTLYNKGYDVFITDVKISIKKGDKSLSIFLYKADVIEDHLMRYRISKKNYLAHILLYGFLEGLRTPHKDLLHRPSIKHFLINMSKRLMSKLPYKESLHKFILWIGKKTNCLFIFDIAFPISYIKTFKTINFYYYQASVPVESEKYLEWMYGKDWRTPNKNYEKQWDFYHDMQRYNTKRELSYNLKKITSILKDNNIHFWMYGGALLGYVRTGDLISWDNDIDLFVWKSDYHKILQLKHKFTESGYKCSVRDGCIMLKWKDYNVTIVHYTLDNDIAYLEKLCTRNKLGNIIYYGLLCKTLYHNMTRTSTFLKWLLLKINSAYKVRQQVPSHFYQNLKTINLCNVNLKVPAETEAYLEYTFGADWRTPIKNFKYTKQYIKVIDGKKPTNPKYHSGTIQ